MGTVKDIVDNPKGGSRVGLIDFIQVRPGGNREGRGGHFPTVSFNLRDCSNVGNSLLLWVARLNNGTELKVADPKEQ